MIVGFGPGFFQTQTTCVQKGMQKARGMHAFLALAQHALLCARCVRDWLWLFSNLQKRQLGSVRFLHKHCASM